MNIKETKELAKKLARKMPARVYALVGDLGAGKTTFVQTFLRELGVKGTITSPTFVLMKKYYCHCEGAMTRHSARSNLFIYHIDAYRLEKTKELLDLGFKKIISDPQNIVLIEWADRVKKIIPKNAFWIYFEHGETVKDRVIKIK